MFRYKEYVVTLCAFCGTKYFLNSDYTYVSESIRKTLTQEIETSSNATAAYSKKTATTRQLKDGASVDVVEETARATGRADVSGGQKHQQKAKYQKMAETRSGKTVVDQKVSMTRESAGSRAQDRSRALSASRADEGASGMKKGKDSKERASVEIEEDLTEGSGKADGTSAKRHQQKAEYQKLKATKSGKTTIDQKVSMTRESDMGRAQDKSKSGSMKVDEGTSGKKKSKGGKDGAYVDIEEDFTKGTGRASAADRRHSQTHKTVHESQTVTETKTGKTVTGHEQFSMMKGSGPASKDKDKRGAESLSGSGKASSGAPGSGQDKSSSEAAMSTAKSAGASGGAKSPTSLSASGFAAKSTPTQKDSEMGAESSAAASGGASGAGPGADDGKKMTKSHYSTATLTTEKQRHEERRISGSSAKPARSRSVSASDSALIQGRKSSLATPTSGSKSAAKASKSTASKSAASPSSERGASAMMKESESVVAQDKSKSGSIKADEEFSAKKKSKGGKDGARVEIDEEVTRGIERRPSAVDKRHTQTHKTVHETRTVTETKTGKTVTGHEEDRMKESISGSGKEEKGKKLESQKTSLDVAGSGKASTDVEGSGATSSDVASSAAKASGAGAGAGASTDASSHAARTDMTTTSNVVMSTSKTVGATGSPKSPKSPKSPGAFGSAAQSSSMKVSATQAGAGGKRRTKYKYTTTTTTLTAERQRQEERRAREAAAELARSRTGGASDSMSVQGQQSGAKSAGSATPGSGTQSVSMHISAVKSGKSTGSKSVAPSSTSEHGGPKPSYEDYKKKKKKDF